MRRWNHEERLSRTCKDTRSGKHLAATEHQGFVVSRLSGAKNLFRETYLAGEEMRTSNWRPKINRMV